jgi:BirA family biotin operon repressor/biotin-[acetyl-CoA-carboxylase] ligase
MHVILYYTISKFCIFLCFLKGVLMLKDEVLLILENNIGGNISGSDIGKSLHLTRAAVWKAVNALRENGYIIEAIQNKGYCLIPQNKQVSISGIRKTLATQTLGNTIEILKTVGSTNEYAKIVAQNGGKDGFVVIAEQQTNGKGRLGRIFVSPKGVGIYMSVLLRPNLTAEDTSFATVAAAVAVSNAIEKVSGFIPDIKWINDIFYNGKKLCGILTEASLECETGKLQYLIIGIGINVSETSVNLPNELSEIATSIFDIVGLEVSRNELIASILNELENSLSMLANQRQNILEQYKKRLFILGKSVFLKSEDKLEKVTAIDIDSNAHLIVQCDDGTIKSISSGEVSIKI